MSINICKYTCLYVYVLQNIDEYMYMYIYTYAYIFIHIFVYMYIFFHIHVYSYISDDHEPTLSAAGIVVSTLKHKVCPTYIYTYIYIHTVIYTEGMYIRIVIYI
jgi:hypothetical protein